MPNIQDISSGREGKLWVRYKFQSGASTMTSAEIAGILEDIPTIVGRNIFVLKRAGSVNFLFISMRMSSMPLENLENVDMMIKRELEDDDRFEITQGMRVMTALDVPEEFF